MTKTNMISWHFLTENAARFFLDLTEFARLEDFYAQCDPEFFAQCAAGIPNDFPLEKVRCVFKDDEAGKAKFLFLCCVASYDVFAEQYAKYSLPEKMLQEIRKDLSYWAGPMKRDYGFYGLSERIFEWVTACISTQIKPYGRLQGNDIHFFHPECSLYRKEDGSLEICKAFAAGNKVHPDLTQHDKCINIHIPASGPLTREGCLDSLRRMCEFSAEYHPDYDYKAIVCYSWILDPVFQTILKEGSNIRKFQELGHVFRLDVDETREVIWRLWGVGGLKMAVEQLPCNSSMEKAVAEYLAQGGKFKEGVLVIFRDELEALLGKAY